MNYHAFTDDSLLLMHHAARGALAVDNELSRLGRQTRFRVRETAEWIRHVAVLEAELHRRGIRFDAIKWSAAWGPAPHLADAAVMAERGAAPKAAAPNQDKPADSATVLRNRVAGMLRRRFRIVSDNDIPR